MGLDYQWFWPSLYSLSGSFGWAAGLLSLHMVLAAALMLGWRTRIIAPLVWYFTLSIQQRNPYVLSMGDYLLQTLLFWGMLLPWNQFWSIDRRRKELSGSSHVYSPACVGVALQMMSVYLFAGLHKVLDPAWHSGFALEAALHKDSLARNWGLQDHSFLFTGSWLETLVIITQFLILVGLWFSSPRLRNAAVGLGFIFHLGTAVLLDLGLFPFIPMAGLVIFLSWSRPDGTHSQRHEFFPPDLPSRAKGFALSLAIFLAVLVNVNSLFQALPNRRLLFVASSVSAAQNWRLFSGPSLTTDLAVSAAVHSKEQNQRIDFRGNGSVRLRNFVRRLAEERFTELRPNFCQFLYGQWRVQHPQQSADAIALLLEESRFAKGQISKLPTRTLHIQRSGLVTR